MPKKVKHLFRKNQSFVTYTDDELVPFKDNMVSKKKNTKKSASTSVRRLQSWFKEKHGMLSVKKKKELTQKGLGNKSNAAQPVETDIENVWSSGAIGLQNPRSLLHLIRWNSVTYLEMRGFKEQHDCQLSDFTVTEQYIEYKDRQTKNR